MMMSQFSKVLMAIDKAHTVPQRVLDCGPGLGTYIYKPISEKSLHF